MLVQASIAASPDISTNDFHKLQVGRWTSIVERTKDRLDLIKILFQAAGAGSKRLSERE